jgi:Na+/H+ antiporter NhaA
MNQLSKSLLCGIAGTTVMTANSALMSNIFGENYREPEHLATMIKRLVPGLSKQANQIAGWGAHCAMGIVFAAVYLELWETKKIRHSIRNGLILGAVSGVLGFLIWKGTFKLHPLPPALNYDHYYLQRISAHIVFAITATLAYRLILKTDDHE